MRYVVLLSVLAVAYSAPVGETEQGENNVIQDDIRVKRAKEIMMFGNQQNEASKDMAKRDYPSENIVVPEDDDETTQPEDLSFSNIEPTDEDTDASNGDIADETDNSQLMETEMPADEEGDASNSEVGTADEANIETNGVDEYLKDLPENDYLKELEAEYNLYKGAGNDVYKGAAGGLNRYDNWGSNYPGDFYPTDPVAYSRFRRSKSHRNFGQTPLSRVLKRSRRIKRDLVYPSDLNQEYFPYTDDRYVNMPYNNYQANNYPANNYPANNYPAQEEDIGYLLDLLDNARGYEDEDDVNFADPYGYAPYEELDDLEYQPTPTEYMVPKRQAGLTFVPGFKRSRDFYPYFEEPESHFSAFVPQKRDMRDYADAYERVMQLAAALRKDNYYPEEYGYGGYDLRKK